MFSLTKRKFPNQTSRQHRSKYNIVHTNHEYECPASRAARPTIYIFTPVIAYLTHILHLCRQACYSPQRNVDTQRRASRTKRGVHYAESSLSWTSTLITSRPRCHGGQGVCDRLQGLFPPTVLLLRWQPNLLPFLSSSLTLPKSLAYPARPGYRVHQHVTPPGCPTSLPRWSWPVRQAELKISSLKGCYFARNLALFHSRHHL
ncbi:unnamed protein product [Ectocarpus fasciculatus]